MRNNKIISNDTIVTDEYTLDGIQNGNILVKSGGVLYLNGILNGDVIIEADATAYIDGIIQGEIINQGGTIESDGIINGNY
jgi:phage baseplate assembly protein gpV